MKKIKFVYQLLLNSIRKHDEKYKEVAVSGEEIHIPTRSGEVRALIYRPQKNPRTCEGTEPETHTPAETDTLPYTEKPALPLLVDFHGGGFVFGMPEMDDPYCRKICDDLGIIVISVDYRLAPEFPYPAALEDAYDVIAFLHKYPGIYGIDPERMAVGGHSAGANISTVVSMMAKKSGEFKLRCQILDYPALDFQTDADLKETPLGGIPPPVMEMFEACYCELEERSDVYVSPLLASDEELKDLPPAIVISAGIDSLKLEDGNYADRLRAVGVPVEHYHYEDVAHGFTISAFSPVSLSEPNIMPGSFDIPALQETAKDAACRIMDILRRCLL